MMIYFFFSKLHLISSYLCSISIFRVRQFEAVLTPKPENHHERAPFKQRQLDERNRINFYLHLFLLACGSKAWLLEFRTARRFLATDLNRSQADSSPYNALQAAASFLALCEFFN